MPKLVFEIGTEEMPAGAIGSAIEQLRASVEGLLAERHLPAAAVTAFGTPRRLVVVADGVPAHQPDITRDVKGPSVQAAFGPDGAPTGAAIGFARKQGVPVESLARIETPQGTYVQATVVDKGKPATEALAAPLGAAVTSLTFPKLMRWGSGGIRYVRPIRWLLALVGTEVCPVQVAGITAGRLSRGHRYLAPDEFEVADADALLPLLRERFVMLDPAERRAAIRAQAEALAAEVSGRVPWDEELLDENVFLVEWPTALRGAIEERFLTLPRPVLVTAMKKHQRFFPVEGADGALLPCFISVRNGGSEHLDTVRAGNERVLAARFADAAFFHADDQKQPLVRFIDNLDRLLFQEKLGTLAEKRRRLQALAGPLADAAGMSGADRERALQAASLCKADLTTRMVIELPALQGIIGREYALAAGDDPAVAHAIAEHYMPRSSGDAIPASAVGRLLAVADRMDTLAGYAGIGIMPSGSSDPFGLRRAAQGVVQILAGEPAMPGLSEMAILAADAYHRVNGLTFDVDALCTALRGLFEQRITGTLLERGLRHDLVAAALSGGPSNTTIVYCAVHRAEMLQQLCGRPDFVATVQTAARVANILRSADAAPRAGVAEKPRTVERAVAMLETEARQVHAGDLAEPTEVALYEAAFNAIPRVAHAAAAYDFEKLYGILGELSAPVAALFDAVLVMAEEPAVRRNRLALLAFVDGLFKTLADFTKVVTA